MVSYQFTYTPVWHPQAIQSQYATSKLSPREQAQRLDACIYPPGLYLLPNPHAPTPAEILNNTYPAHEPIENLPRRAQFHGRPGRSIAFTVRGQPAPYLKDVLKGRVVLDGATELVMADTDWVYTLWVLDWPGYELSTRQRLVVPGLTRLALLQTIAKGVGAFLHSAPPSPSGDGHPWAARKVHFGDVRILALNYYAGVWVPVLALDVV
ncbi:hypothetical protein C8R46DRAFT_1026477 [Mycena filopes]|nr:hypothetical protein C8R46DRAFT_1026477 [Mycena filopes]